jgi:hypothetical protein
MHFFKLQVLLSPERMDLTVVLFLGGMTLSRSTMREPASPFVSGGVQVDLVKALSMATWLWIVRVSSLLFANVAAMKKLSVLTNWQMISWRKTLFNSGKM